MRLSELLPCENALSKLFAYNYLPARQMFYLSTMQRAVMETLDAYDLARKALFIKYGSLSEDGNQYIIPRGGEAEKSFLSELSALEAEEAALSFPEDKITLCLESIEKVERDLPADKHLGFSAHDWAAVQKIIKVVETEG